MGLGDLAELSYVSIHAPPNRKERPGADCNGFQRAAVSIHAPPNRKERLGPIRSIVSRTDVFQSTPLPTGRSDTGWLSRARPTTSFNPRPSQPEGATVGQYLDQDLTTVSIHAPPNRKERPYGFGEGIEHAAVSIHAPPNRKERQPAAVESDHHRGFNPRPSQPEGATSCTVGPVLH